MNFVNTILIVIGIMILDTILGIEQFKGFYTLLGMGTLGFFELRDEIRSK